MISPWKLGWLNPKTMSCTGPIAISLPLSLSPIGQSSAVTLPAGRTRAHHPARVVVSSARAVGQASMGDQVDHPEVGQPVEGQLDSQRREQEAEDLLGHQHAVLVEVLAEPVGPPEHRDVDGDDNHECPDDHTEDTGRSGFRRDRDQYDDPRWIEEVRDGQRKDGQAHRVLAGEKCSSLVRSPPRTSRTIATAVAVVSIFRTTRLLVAAGMSAVTSRNGTSAILGPMPIRSRRKMSITQAASTDSNSIASASRLSGISPLPRGGDADLDWPVAASDGGHTRSFAIEGLPRITPRRWASNAADRVTS